MSTLLIVVAVMVGLSVLTFVYSLFRVPLRLRKGDVERDSDTWRRRKEGR